MSIVGFVGFIGSGKGSAGDILTKWHYTKMAFADPVKDATAAIFGWPRALLEGDTVESRAFREEPDAFWSQVWERQFTPREALQKMGTECGRNVFHPDLWTAALEKRVQSNLNGPNVVVTDCRFDNEIKLIHRLGGKVIWIKRGPDPEWFDLAQTIISGSIGQMALDWGGKIIHRSEWDWVNSPIDHIIQNDGDLKDLERELTILLLS